MRSRVEDTREVISGERAAPLRGSYFPESSSTLRRLASAQKPIAAHVQLTRSLPARAIRDPSSDRLSTVSGKEVASASPSQTWTGENRWATTEGTVCHATSSTVVQAGRLGLGRRRYRYYD